MFRIRPVSILDDSDPPRRVPLWREWNDEEGVPKEVRARIQSALEGRGDVGWNRELRREHVAGIGAGVVAGLLTLSFFLIVGVNTASAWFGSVPFMVGFIVGGLVTRHMIMGQNRQPIRATLLAAGCCASCGYVLSTPPDASGRTTCPECNARWRLPADEGVGDHPEAVPAPMWSRLESFSLAGTHRTGSLSAPDARGRIVELVYPLPALRPPSMWHTIPEDDRIFLERQLQSMAMVHRPFAAAGIVLASIVVIVLIYFGISSGSWANFIYAGFLVLGIICLAGTMRVPHVSDRERLISLLVCKRRCASCGGDLAESDPDEEGIATCPHCRAAWRLPEHWGGQNLARRQTAAGSPGSLRTGS